MKKLFFAAIVVLTQGASANQPKPDENTKIVSYEVTKAGSKFSKAHISSLGHGGVELNYARGTVSLRLEENSNCPKDHFCTMEARGIFLELPIVQIKKNPCSNTVIAREDKRPVDGYLQQITIDDYNVPSACRFIMAPIPRGTYTTSFVNRTTGKSVTKTSTFSTNVTEIRYETPSVASELYQFAYGEIKGLKYYSIEAGELIIESGKVIMTLSVNDNCPPKAACSFMPNQKIEIQLPILTREYDKCGETILTGPVGAQQLGGPVEALEIRKHVMSPKALCNSNQPAHIEVRYSKRYAMPGKNLEAKLWFSEVVAY